MGVGREPQQGQGIGMPDFVWLRGVVGGQNLRATSGLTALAGGAQAGATLLGAPNNQGDTPALVEVDTVVTAADSCLLPFAVHGQWMFIRNAGAASMTVFAQPTNNRSTGALDSVNGGTNVTGVAIGANHGAIAFCAKDGAWTLLVV